MTIDVEKLKGDLIDYYGTAAFNGFPAAIVDVTDVQKATLGELVELARRAGFDLNEYEDDYER